MGIEPGRAGAKMTLDKAGLSINQIKEIKTKRDQNAPFAANDLYFARQYGIDVNNRIKSEKLGSRKL